MQVDSGCTAKEETILELSEENNKLLYDLRAKLRSAFAKLPEGEAESKRPEEPNILDEIIAHQKTSRALIRALTEFIHVAVISKIQ